MKGTRIMVFSMKNLIKTAIFIIAGLALIITLIFAMISKNENGANANSGYLPGTYAAQIVLHQSPVDIEVTVNDKEIIGIEMKNMKSVQQVFYPLFEPTLDELTKQVIRYQSTKIATTIDRAVTSRILLDAIDTALQQADPKSAAVK